MSAYARYTPEERDRIHAWILATLEDRGPRTSAELGLELGLEPRQAAWFCARLHECGQIASLPRVRRPGQPRQTARWQRVPDAPAPRRNSPGQYGPARGNWGIDAEHEAWMAYWSQPRDERRRMGYSQYLCFEPFSL